MEEKDFNETTGAKIFCRKASTHSYTKSLAVHYANTYNELDKALNDSEVDIDLARLILKEKSSLIRSFERISNSYAFIANYKISADMYTSNTLPTPKLKPYIVPS